MRFTITSLLIFLSHIVFADERKVPSEGEFLPHKFQGELGYMSDLLGSHVFWLDKSGEPVPLNVFLDIYDACSQKAKKISLPLYSLIDQCYINRGYKLHEFGAE